MLSERVLLRPAPRTFYARDALNPDLVRVGRRYLLYFSGNDQASDAGRWRTGLAVAASPLGPFRVEHGLSLPFLNGGTVYDGRRFYQGATASTSLRPALYRSPDGRRWHRLDVVPEPPPPAWDRLRSDLYLVRRPLGLDIYYAGRPGPSGADLGRLRYRSGRFRGNGELVLEREAGAWDGLDLGEPALFRARGRTYMVYTAQGDQIPARRIGLAYLSSGRFMRCPRPLVELSQRYPQNAIDPEPLVEGGRLYLYFGGGTRPSLGGNMTGTIWLRVYRL